MKEISAVTYLMTKEDYINCMIAAKTGKTEKQDKTLVIFVGIMFCIIGVLFQVVPIKMLTVFEKRLITTVLGIAGIFMAAYYDLLSPMLEKIKAEKFCKKNSDKMISNTITLCESGIKVKNDRYEAKLPFEVFCRSYENENVFVLYYNISECIFIPKRTMNDKTADLFSEMIHKNIK